jgi:exonuclease VII small subunit
MPVDFKDDKPAKGRVVFDEDVPPKAATEGLAPGLTPPPVATPTEPRKPATEKPKARTSALSDVLNRGLVAGTLGAPVDIAAMAMRPFGYKEEQPVGGSEYIGSQMERMGLVSPTRRPGAELAAGLAPAVLGLGAGAVSKGVGAVGKALDFYKLSKGSEAEKLAKALKAETGEKVGGVIAGAEESAAKAGERIGRIGEAEQQLGARGKVAGEREAARQQTANESLDALSPNKVLAEDVGNIIQTSGRTNVQSMAGSRQQQAIRDIKDPAFTEAKSREASGDFISTNPKSSKEFNNVISRIESQILRTPEPFRSSLQRTMSSLKGEERQLTEAEKRVEQLRSASVPGYQARSSATNPMTLEQAEFLRRMLKDKQLGDATGFSALDVANKNALAKDLTKAMEAYEPRLGEYISKYRELSAPIERATAGRGGALTEAELLGDEGAALFAADKSAATSYYLNGTQERAQRLIDLVGGKKPELVNSIKGYFRNEMEGMTSKQAENFIQKQEGFLREFPELKDPMQKIAESKKVAETAGPAATQKAKEAAIRLSGEKSTLTSEQVKTESQSLKYEKLSNQLDVASGKELPTKAREIVNNLMSDRLIDSNTHADVLRQIKMIEDRFGQSEQAKQTINALMRKTLLYGGAGLGVAGVPSYYFYKSQSQ